MREGWLLLGGVVLLGCSSSEAPAKAPEASASVAAEPAKPSTPATPEVSRQLFMHLPLGAACEAGDVCGFFLQVISPGSDPGDLADKAVKIIQGKCGGHVVPYKDSRGVMGAGSVFPTEAEKHACEQALGRPQDTDFPKALVFRAVK